MGLFRTMREALSQISRNKLRTFLTMLGLIVGVSSVIVLVGLGEGSNKEVEEQMEALGGNILTGYLFDEALKYEDFDAIRDLPAIESVSPSKAIGADVSYEKERSNRAMVDATDEFYLETRNLSLESGRNLTSVDRQNKSKVCILGPAVAQDLFNSTDVVGKTIKLNGNRYTVIGVLKKQGESIGMSAENLVIIPFSLFSELGAEEKIDNFYARANEDLGVTFAKSALTNYLSEEKQIPSGKFMVNTQDEMLNAEDSIDETMTIFLAGIAGISLIVAGIGVMNVMLVSVAERVREIGIKKALGAQKVAILAQFLIEALSICLVGGALGVVVGVVCGLFANSAGVRFEASESIVLIAVGASVLVGLVFGIFPAYRASRLNPIDALRQE